MKYLAALATLVIICVMAVGIMVSLLPSGNNVPPAAPAQTAQIPNDQGGREYINVIWALDVGKCPKDLGGAEAAWTRSDFIGSMHTYKVPFGEIGRRTAQWDNACYK